MRHIATCLMLVLLVSACAEQKMPGTKIGKPYIVDGQAYYPSYDPAYDKTGIASWYGPGFHGKYTASGEVYDQGDYTAAHPTLPMPSLVRVTNLENGKSLVVRINDRGPFKASRIIDLSKKSAEKLGIKSLARVRVQFLQQETERYLAMVKENNGRVVRMAEYHKRAAEPPVVAPEPELTQMADAAPVRTVGVDEEVELTVVSPAPIRPTPAKKVAAASKRAPSLLVQEALAEEEGAGGDDTDTGFTPVPAKSPESEKTMGDAAPSSGGDAGEFTVQAGAFSSEANARKLADRLSEIADVAIEQADSGNATLWRVRVGAFERRADAEMTLAQVRASGAREARIVRR